MNKKAKTCKQSTMNLQLHHRHIVQRHYQDLPQQDSPESLLQLE